MHVVGEKKTLGQCLGNPATFTLLLHPYAGGRRQRLAVQQKLGFPRWGHLGGGRNPHSNLGLWLADNNPPCWLGRGMHGSISRAGGGLVGDFLLLFGPPCLGRGWRLRHLTPTLRRWGLIGLPGTEHEPVDGHDLP